MFNGYPNAFGENIALMAQKAEFKKRVTVAGVCMLAVFGISRAWAYAYFYLTGMFGISVQAAREFVSSPMAGEILQIIISTFAMTVPFLIGLSFLRLRTDDVIPFGAPEKNVTVPLLLFGMGCCTFANYAVSRAGQIFESFGFSYSVTPSEEPTGFFGTAVVIIASAVFPALVEEFAFRGVIMGILMPFGEGFSIVATAALFGILHGNFEQIPFAFLVGLILCFIRAKTGSIWPGIILHFLNNLYATVMGMLYDTLPVFEVSLIFGVFRLLVIVLGIIGLYKYITVRKTEPYLKGDTVIPERKKYLWFATSPAVIAFTLFAVVLSLRFFN